MRIRRHLGGLLLAFTVSGFAAGCASTNWGAPRNVPVHDAKAFYETVSYVGASFNADESELLVSNDSSGVFNVYAQPIAGGPPRQLTHSHTNATFGVSWFPADNRFLYTADQGGNELNHLYVRELDGSDRDLTPGDQLKADFAGWSGDRKHFYITTNERDPQAFDVYRYATDGYARELLFRNEQAFDIGGVSDDGRWVALQKNNSSADGDIYLWDAQAPAAAPRCLTTHEGAVAHSFLTFTPDSRELWYSTDAGGEFAQAWSYDLASGAKKERIAADWDVAFVNFSETGRFRVSGVNADARTAVTILDTRSGRPLEVGDLPPGDLTGVNISRSEKRLAFYLNGDTSPSNLFVLDLESRALTRLTQSLNPAIAAADLVEARVVRYPSFDGVRIPALLYKPWPASADRPAPALVWVHGGPGGQSRHGYSATIQHLVNNGYAVLAVNNRGSSGYGKTFFHMDDRRHGDVDLKDCVWARKYLESVDWVDGERIGIIGGSYGGYMVAAALAFESDVFDVGINIFGVTNWLRTLKSIPPWWASFRTALYDEMGDPEKDQARLAQYSPLLHAQNIRKPLLVVQGANDPRVLQVESDELVAAARRNGAPVEYIVFPDEGHGFRARANRIRASEAYVNFLNRYLKGAPLADTAR